MMMESSWSGNFAANEDREELNFLQILHLEGEG